MEKKSSEKHIDRKENILYNIFINNSLEVFTMNRSELKNRAKQSLTGNWGAAIIGVIVYMLVVSFLSSTGVVHL